MQIRWVSRQGRARLGNSDAAACGRKNHQVLAVLVDAAEKGDGQGLARYWPRTVINAALGTTRQLDLEVLVDIMRIEQQQLRRHYLHAIASYCCVLVDQEQQLLHAAHVGDCLIGIQRPAGAIDWLNLPQNLQSQAIWLADMSVDQESRHLLTRSLNARRFNSPVCLTTQLPPDARVLLCSDGYWHEHVHSGVGLESVNDDASVLSLAYGESGIDLQSDCENFHECSYIVLPASS